jgi:hypothetical protein
MSKILKNTLVAVAVASPLALTVGTGEANAEPTYVTGCLNGRDVIKHVVLGTSPAYACKSSWPQITWELVDPDAPPAPPPPNSGGPAVGFYVALDGDGAEQTLATSGPLEFFARCTISGTTTVVDILATSSQDGWFSSMGGPHAAGEELLHYSLESDGTAPEYGDHSLRFESSIVSPDGHFLAVGNETMTLGARMFGHDCLAIGTAIVVTGNP